MKRWMKYGMLYMVLSILLVTASCQKASDSSGDNNFTKGVEYASQGLFDDAKRSFHKVKEDSAVYPVAMACLEIIDDVGRQKTERSAALNFFNGANLANNPKERKSKPPGGKKSKIEHALTALDEMMDQDKITKERIAAYDKAIEIDPGFVYAYLSRGNCWGDLVEYDRAIEDFSKAIEIEPRDAKLYTNRAIIYRKKRQFDRAMQDYNKALEIDPQYIDAYENRGLAWLYQKNYDHAIEDFSQAIKLNPGDTKPYVRRGLTYKITEQYDLAVADFSQAIKIDPADASLYVRRGSVYKKQGQHDHAIGDFTKTIKFKPQYTKAYTARGSLYMIKGETEKGCSDYQKACDLDDCEDYNQARLEGDCDICRPGVKQIYVLCSDDNKIRFATLKELGIESMRPLIPGVLSEYDEKIKDPGDRDHLHQLMASRTGELAALAVRLLPEAKMIKYGVPLKIIICPSNAKLDRLLQ